MRNRKFPLVTVITPTYNRASFLEETIESVLSQDYPYIEYIVLDDGSTDATKKLIRNYKNRLIFSSHNNMGETGTVNKGFSMAHGDIITVVNSDDPLRPHAIKTAVKFLEKKPEILVAYSDVDLIGPKSELINHGIVPEHDYEFMYMYQHCSISNGAFIRSKAIQLIGGRNSSYKYIADFEFWLRLGLYGPFARIPEPLATHRRHDGAQSIISRNKMAEESIRLVRDISSLKNFPTRLKKFRKSAYSSAYFSGGIYSTSVIKKYMYYLISFFYDPCAFAYKSRREFVGIKRKILDVVKNII